MSNLHYIKIDVIGVVGSGKTLIADIIERHLKSLGLNAFKSISEIPKRTEKEEGKIIYALKDVLEIEIQEIQANRTYKQGAIKCQ